MRQGRASVLPAATVGAAISLAPKGLPNVYEKVCSHKDKRVAATFKSGTFELGVGVVFAYSERLGLVVALQVQLQLPTVAVLFTMLNKQ